MKAYVVVTKSVRYEPHMRGDVGRSVLMSFARKPMWTAYHWLKVQGQDIPNVYTKADCEYALKKYGGDSSEIISYEQAKEEIEQFSLKGFNRTQ